MIDTITLQINRLEIDEKYLNRFQRNTVGKPPTIKYIFNPNTKKDGYLPRITIKKLEGQRDWYTESIDIEFSAPKILCGTNYFGVDENDYNKLLDSLLEKLSFIFNGSPFTKDQIQQSNIKTIAFVFNFILPDSSGRPIEFLKVIPFLDIGKNYNKSKNTYFTEENELGYCGRIYNKQVSFKIYDKGAELINNAKTTKEIETVSKIKQGLLPIKVIRMEITYQNKFTLKRHLATKTDGNNKRERHLSEVFNNKLCQSILLESFNKLADEVNIQALDTPLYPMADCLKTIKEAGMYPYDAYAWLGRSLAIQQAGSLQLKLINDDYFSRQDRSRVDKKFRKLLDLHSLPFFTLKKVFDECRKQLNEFKVMKPEDYS
jgi:hypothetical protein